MFSRGNLFFVDQCVQDRQLQPSALKHKIFKLQVHYEVYVVFFFFVYCLKATRSCSLQLNTNPDNSSDTLSAAHTASCSSQG